MTDGPIRVAFMCVRNAGRSQMATGFAERERAERGLEDQVVIETGGTHPADAVHEVVIESMAAVGIDLSERIPRPISTDELTTCDIVITMGCSTLDLDADSHMVDVRDWDLDDPNGEALEVVRTIREEIRGNVAQLFDEIERTVTARA